MSEPNRYSITINRWADDEPAELIDRYITAEQAIDLMLYIQKNVPEASEEEEEESQDEEEEPEIDHVANGKKGGARKGQVRKCSNCGEPGHTYRTCPKKADGEADEEPAAASPEEEEPAEVPYCTKCEERGHTADECRLVSDPEPEPAEDHRSLTERVKELWEGGLAVEEIYDCLPSEEMVEINAIYQDLERKRFD